jgi:cyclohexanone monooxygenase
MRKTRLTSVDVLADVEEQFNAEIEQRMEGTVWTTGGCGSWYLDANGRNSTLWPGFSFELRWRTRSFDLAAYRVQHAPTVLSSVRAS